MGTIRLTLAPDIISALARGQTITIALRQGKAGKPEALPRAGTFNAKLIAWAKRRKSFTTRDVVEKFECSRAHASMLLSRLEKGAYPIERISRGVYRHTEGKA